jgi:hypothetical protein
MEPPTRHLADAFLIELPHGEMLVLPGPPTRGSDPLVEAWRAACDEAMFAYEAWREAATAESFSVYRAAADREEAAAVALAAHADERRSRRRH